MQVKLYRVLQEGKVRPPGAAPKKAHVDVRVIAATNKDFAKEIAEGRFPRRSLLPLERDPHPSFLHCASVAKIFRCWRGSFLDRYSKSMGQEN